MAFLTPEENHIITVLSKCKGKSIWHDTIAEVLPSGTAQDKKRLIAELRHEMEGHTGLMKEILGVEAVEALETI